MASSPSAVSNLPAGYTLEQSSAPQPQQGEVPGLPAGYKLQTDSPQSTPSTGLTDGSVPNARIRNLPNPAAKATSAGGALLDGVETGAQLAAIPSSVAGLSAASEGAESAVTSVVDKAKAIVQWAKANPIKATAVETIAREMGIDPFQLMHKAVKYGQNLFGDDSDKKP